MIGQRREPFAAACEEGLQGVVGQGEVAVGQDALEVVEDHQGRLLGQGLGDGFDRVALVDGEVVAHQRVAQLGQHDLQAGAALEGDEGGAPEEAGAHQPAGGVRGQAGLALAAEAVQHDDRFGGKGALQGQQLAGAAVEAVLRLRREAGRGRRGWSRGTDFPSPQPSPPGGRGGRTSVPSPPGRGLG